MRRGVTMQGNKGSWITKGLKIAWILCALISIIIWLPKADHLISQDYEQISKHIKLDDQWEITINDKAYHNISFDDFRFETVKIGDIIVMERQLPKDWEMKEAVLRFYIRQSAVKMYINEDLIYEYGQDRLAQNKTLGSGFQFIDFPNDYKGKTLKIELNLTENRVFSRFDSIRIYEWGNVYRVLLTENRIPMFFGSFFVIFGIAIMIITMFALVFSKKYIRVFCLSLFSVCMGLWTLCYYNVILIYAIPVYSVSLMEYLTLYLSPVPLIIYMYEDVKKLKYKALEILYWILFFIQLLCDIVIFTLHTMDIVHCAAALSYMQILIVCHLIYFIIVMIMNLKSSKLISKLYLIGMLTIAGCIGYDMFCYYMRRYQGRSISSLKGMSAIGMMIFIFILIISFYINLTRKMMQETERISLIKSAYTDELTQLNNRRYCSEHMKKINEDRTGDYAIICFDLNNLKVINDTYGHSKGDILIKSAADIIRKTFEKQGVVGRMGGDEFIAILSISNKEQLELLLKQFHDNIFQKNQEVNDLNISIAYGYAFSGEIEEKDIEKIYQIADDRMYENKKEYKQKNGIVGR